MLGHLKNDHSLAYFMELLGHFPPANHPCAQPMPFPPPLAIPINEHGSLSALSAEFGCTSFCAGSRRTLTERSFSSYYLQKNLEVCPPMNSCPPGHFESEANPVRELLSTDDLLGVKLARQNQLPHKQLATETSVIENMNRAGSRYSPEEKRERIERYRTKRNRRNFTKKIKYECRKSLANSRPRIRGRFARNNEI